MTCCNKKYHLTLYKGKKETIPFQIRIGGSFIDLNGKTIKMLVMTQERDDYQDEENIIKLLTINVNITTNIAYIVLDEDFFDLVEKGVYKVIYKITETGEDPIRSDLYYINII